MDALARELKRGSAELKAEGSDEVTVLGPGAILGEHSAISGEPSTVSAVARGDFEAFVLRASDLVAIVKRSPERRQAWLKAATPAR